MKKVLIISYFFPPCNLTAAQRIGSWYKYLPENGYYPIVVTRNWTGEELTEEQRLTNSGSSVRIEKKENGEVYYMPYKSSWRDNCFIKSKSSKVYSFLSKALTALQLILQNFTVYAIPYRNIYFQAKKIIRENEEIKCFIISGNPFEQFYFGSLLKREFPRLNWIADYRDDWTTTELIKNRSTINNLIHNIEKKSEKKWIRTAYKISSVSQHYVNKITSFTSTEGFVLQNGFDEALLNTKMPQEVQSAFTLLYNGTLYSSQIIETFIEGFKKFVDANKGDSDITLKFIGLAIDSSQEMRVRQLFSGYENYLEITNRVPKNYILEEQLKADVLLMFPHKNAKGVPSSKIFEYIGLKKQFIVCPSDNDILEEIANKSSLGVLLNSSLEVTKFLQEKLVQKKDRINIQFDQEAIEMYSIKAQVRHLSLIFDKHYYHNN